MGVPYLSADAKGICRALTQTLHDDQDSRVRTACENQPRRERRRSCSPCRMGARRRAPSPKGDREPTRGSYASRCREHSDRWGDLRGLWLTAARGGAVGRRRSTGSGDGRIGDRCPLCELGAQGLPEGSPSLPARERQRPLPSSTEAASDLRKRWSGRQDLNLRPLDPQPRGNSPRRVVSHRSRQCGPARSGMPPSARECRRDAIRRRQQFQ
jgi:hypothetical protein